jgi:hypothetical protein
LRPACRQAARDPGLGRAQGVSALRERRRQLLGVTAEPGQVSAPVGRDERRIVARVISAQLVGDRADLRHDLRLRLPAARDPDRAVELADRLFQGLNSAISGFDSRSQIVDGREDLRVGRPTIVNDWRYIRSTDWESRPHSNPRHSLTRACVGPPARSPDQRSDQTTAATTGQGNLAAKGHDLAFYWWPAAPPGGDSGRMHE